MWHINIMGKTGGGPGTNQYRVRGSAQHRTAPPKSVLINQMFDSRAEENETETFLAILSAADRSKFAKNGKLGPDIINKFKCASDADQEWVRRFGKPVLYLAAINDNHKTIHKILTLSTNGGLDDTASTFSFIQYLPNKEDDCPWEALINHPNSEIRTLTCYNQYAPQAIIAKTIKIETEPKVLSALCLRQFTNREERIAHHKSLIDRSLEIDAPVVLHDLSHQPFLDGPTVNYLANRCDRPEILGQIADRPDLEDALLQKMIGMIDQDAASELHRGLANNHNCPPQVLRRLGSSDDSLVRYLLICNPTCPLDVKLQWIDDKDGAAREVLAEIVQSPTHIEKLARDDSAFVRAKLASNLACPAPILIQLSQDADRRVRTQAMLNPNLPEHARVILNV